MGCTSEKCIPESNFNKKNKYLIITDGNIELDLQDIEQQGESKHPQKEINNNEEIEEQKNFYNYNLNDLILVNNTKMTVKRIEYFEDDDDDDDEDDDENKDENKQLENIKEENNEDEKQLENDEEIKVNEEKDKNISLIEDSEKKPEDKKPPNIEKLRKKGKEKKEINFF